MFERSLKYAIEKHRNQSRKYNGQPYVVHCINVYVWIKQVTDDKKVHAAALLHDTVEDTDATINDIKNEFGDDVALLVEELTDVYTSEKYPKINRKGRKELERKRISVVSKKAKSIKLADCIDNLDDIVHNDPGFGKVFLDEIELLFPLISEGDERLSKMLASKMKDAKKYLDELPSESFESNKDKFTFKLEYKFGFKKWKTIIWDKTESSETLLMKKSIEFVSYAFLKMRIDSNLDKVIKTKISIIKVN